MKINTYAVNCNDAWLNTEGDDISGSYVKYKDHQDVVAALEAKCAALAAKGMELAAEAAVVYGKYNETQMPDRDLVDMQTLQEMHDLCAGVKNADAFLAEVRAQGVDAAIEHLHKLFGSTDNIVEPIRSLEWLAKAFRKGAAQ